MDEELRERTRVDGVLTVIDTVHFLQHLQRVRGVGWGMGVIWIYSLP